MDKPGSEIKKRRKEIGLTQAELGKLCNVSAVTIGHWENNRNQFNGKNLISLCLSLGCAPSDILEPDQLHSLGSIDIDASIVMDRYLNGSDELRAVVKRVLGIDSNK